MVQLNQPNVAADLIRIHSVVTRGLKVSLERSQVFAQTGFPDSSTQEGFVSYVQSLVAVLQAHHLAEDELAFPYLRDLLPGAPFDLLIEQHQRMVPILDEITKAIDAVATEGSASQRLGDLHHVLTQVADLWHPHIQIEEEHLSVEKGAEVMSVDEHISLSGSLAKYSQEHAKPDYLVVPFILYNLAPQDRAIMAAAMPPIVTQELVPKAWKEKWSPMQPFLLS